VLDILGTGGVSISADDAACFDYSLIPLTVSINSRYPLPFLGKMDPNPPPQRSTPGDERAIYSRGCNCTTLDRDRCLRPDAVCPMLRTRTPTLTSCLCSRVEPNISDIIYGGGFATSYYREHGIYLSSLRTSDLSNLFFCGNDLGMRFSTTPLGF
jgi:hypothetical protein